MLRISLIISFSLPFVLFAQNNHDTLPALLLKRVIVPFRQSQPPLSSLPDQSRGIIYAGKKTEQILPDSLSANKALDNSRIILGRVPGLIISETETGGFTANGIGIRGLNPVQSLEMNTRQNGYNISGDVFGYNESYYLPPLEAVSRIELVTGAASLQFGPQFGGLVNYILKEPPTYTLLEFHTSETTGSYGLFNTLNSLGGRIGKWSYYTYGQWRSIKGWRPNSRQWQFNGYGKIQFDPSKNLHLSLEYTAQRNRVKMPGGLTDSMFKADPRASLRSRNWLSSPWNILSATVTDSLSAHTYFKLQSTFLHGRRNLVWRNEDGGPEALDTLDPTTGQYIPREVEAEHMNNFTTELRILHSFGRSRFLGTLAAGLRYSRAWFTQKEGGEGSTGSDFDLAITKPFPTDLQFTTTNFAPFAENIFHLGPSFNLTPGVRLEYLKSTAAGYQDEDTLVQHIREQRTRWVPLLGLGMQYTLSGNQNIYGNISQAYRPTTYDQLTPVGVTSVIDPKLKDSKGYSATMGYRGGGRNGLYYDFDLFYMSYQDRPGLVLMNPGTPDEYTYRTNIAGSVHMGWESYLTLNLLGWMQSKSAHGLNLFNSMALMSAKYNHGPFKGKWVEGAVPYVIRTGLAYSGTHFGTTIQISNTGRSFGDASNAIISSDPAAGVIPAYAVVDFSLSYRLKNMTWSGGISNVANKKYFTLRTDEYPGPGIIPSDGRSVYLSLSATF